MNTVCCILHTCTAGAVLPLVTEAPVGMAAHVIVGNFSSSIPVGTELCTSKGKVLLRVTGRVSLTPINALHAQFYPLVTAVCDIAANTVDLMPRKQGKTLAWITLSDKGSVGLREDTSGPAIEETLRKAIPIVHSQGFLLPDNAAALSSLLMELALGQGYDYICTTGGTGMGLRDITPQATRRVLDYELPGFTQAMMQFSLTKTPHAMISRAIAGVLGQSIIINLPGSYKAVRENLTVLLPALPHALDKLQGDLSDCATTTTINNKD